jgi:hypothetical protein
MAGIKVVADKIPTVDQITQAVLAGHSSQDIQIASGSSQRADLSSIWHGPYASQYNTNLAAQAYQLSAGQSEQDILNQPQSPTTLQDVYSQPTGSVPGDAQVPGSGDTDTNGPVAPWEQDRGVVDPASAGIANGPVPTADQDI